MKEGLSSMRYRVDRTYDKPLSEVFPDLFRLPEFKKIEFTSSWERKVKYILLMYSKDTPLAREYESNLRARKEAALSLSGFERTDGERWESDARELMDISDKEIFNCIMAFLKIQKHMVWTEIIVTEQELYEFQKLRFMSIDITDDATSEKDIYEAAKKKDTLKNACESRIKYLGGLYAEFYGDSKTELMSSVYLEMITPEKAERILEEDKKKELVVDGKEAETAMVDERVQ